MSVITIRQAVAGRDLRKVFLVILVALTAGRLALSGALELHFDETYYWYWAQNPNLSYFDHPPMVAWLIAAGTALFGNGEFGVRVFASLCGAGATWFVFDAASRSFGTRLALFAGGAMQATVLIGIGSLLMTPDMPLLLFSAGMIWALLGLARDGRPARWILAGMMAGCAMLSKYTAVLPISAVGLWLLLTPAMRRWLATPWPWAGVLVAAVVFSPVIVWNFQHDWVSFGKQGGRLFEVERLRPGQVLEYFGGQLGLLTPVLCTFLGWCMFRLCRSAASWRDPSVALLLWSTLVPACFFLVLSPLVRVQANWTGPMVPAIILAATAYLSQRRNDRSLEKPIIWSLATGGGLVIAIWAVALVPFGPCVAGDPTALLTGQRGLAVKTAAYARQWGITQIGSADYDTASMLRFYAPGELHVFDIPTGQRYTGFDDPGPHPSEPALILTAHDDLPERATDVFSQIGKPVEIWRQHRGCDQGRYLIFKLEPRRK